MPYSYIKRTFLLKPFLAILLMLVPAVSFFGQTPQWNWALKGGGNRNEAGRQVLCDPSGNLFSWGIFGSNTQFGSTTLTLASSSGQYIAKHGPTGTAIWAKKMPVQATIKHAALDAQGNLYITGEFYGTLTLGASSITCPSGPTKCFIAKYSPTGNVIWLKKKGTNSSQRLTMVLLLKKWNTTHFIASGRSIADTVDRQYLRGADWLAKMDTAGNFSSFTALDSLGYYAPANGSGLSVSAIAVDSKKNIYINGNYVLNGHFEPTVWHLDTVSGGGKTKAFLARFDANLNFVWSKMTYCSSRYGPGFGYLGSTGLAIDPQDNLFSLGGFVTDSISFDATHCHSLPQHPSSSTTGNLLVKYKDDGAIVWDSIFLSVDPFVTNFSSICTDKAGGIYCAGNFTGGLTLNHTTVYASGNGNVFVAKFGGDGKALWLQNNTLPGLSSGAMDEDGKGNLYFTGGFIQGNTAFGTTTLTMTTPATGHPYDGDLFIARLGNCSPAAPVLTPTASTHLCNNDSLLLSSSLSDHYVWSTGDTTSTIYAHAAGTYSVYGVSNLGCYKSSGDIQITTGSANSQVTVSGETLLTTETGSSYQWVDCGNAFAAIATATAQTYAPLQSGSYALVIEQNNCVDTSSCYAITVNPLSVKHEADALIAFQLFPNPNNGHCTVVVNGQGEQCRLSLVNVLGETVLEKEITSGPNDCNWAELSNGIYYLELTSNGKQASQKVIIQH